MQFPVAELALEKRLTEFQVAVDADGRITVKGFYDAVRPMTDLERTAMRELPFDEAGFIRESGAPAAFGEQGFSTLERITARPTLDVNGMWSGYVGEGAKTVQFKVGLPTTDNPFGRGGVWSFRCPAAL